MQMVKVRLRKPTRVFLFLSSDMELARGEACIVRSDRGLEYGTCVVPPEYCPEEMKERVTMSVVRKATPNDQGSFRQIELDEEKAKRICAGRIKEHRLPMKLVDAEYTFDKHKITFSFTADDRVDFRELVRDLAQELRTRIELRHIPVRDEAKLVGGIGVCGRELCCSTWLREFLPISMKMAKRQNLSLNPSKISGQCGRLLCCLAYENEMYPAKKGKAAAGAGAGERTTEWSEELAEVEEDVLTEDIEESETPFETDEFEEAESVVEAESLDVVPGPADADAEADLDEPEDELEAEEEAVQGVGGETSPPAEGAKQEKPPQKDSGADRRRRRRGRRRHRR